MPTKKIITMLVIASTVVALAWCKTKKADETPAVVQPAEQTAQVEQPAPQAQDAKKTPATKDQCMDLTAYAMKVAIDKAQGKDADALKRAQMASDLEVKYGAMNVEYEEACGTYMTDPSFMQAVQKRIAELK